MHTLVEFLKIKYDEAADAARLLSTNKRTAPPETIDGFVGFCSTYLRTVNPLVNVMHAGGGYVGVFRDMTRVMLQPICEDEMPGTLVPAGAVPVTTANLAEGPNLKPADSIAVFGRN